MSSKEIEIIDEFFVAAHRDSQGRLYPLSPLGMFVLEEFKNNWLGVQVPEGQTPRVSVGPTKLDDGLEVYSIRKEIVPQEPVPTFPPPNIPQSRKVVL
ncbi:MAG: hypothetical protein ABSA43_00040 [Candidatus Microgenomates bacterium]|jgi:hypothetical protein